MKRGRRIFFILLLLVLAFFAYKEFTPKNSAENFITCPSYILDSNTTPAGNLTVAYLNVSQGDSIFISNNNETMLIDCGPTGTGARILNYLNSLNIKTLDYLIITHNHEDHLGSCEDVLKNIEVKKVIMNGKSSTTRSYKDVIKLINSQNLIVADTCFNGNLGNSNWQIIHSNTNNSDNENQNSIVMTLKYGKTGFLFTGDCDSNCEQSLLKQNLDVDFLKIAHHCSEYGTTTKFLEKTTPRIAFIEVGKNTYGHPNPNCLTRLQDKGIQILRTDFNGTTTLKTDGENYWFYSEN